MPKLQVQKAQKKQEPKKDAFADFGAFSTPTLEFEPTPRKDDDDGFGDFGDFEDAQNEPTT